MLKKLAFLLRLGLLLVVSAALLSGGCTTVKQWAGYGTADADEETVPPEAKQETVMIDGKPYVRSKNPYWMSVQGAPEYLNVEKGKEVVNPQTHSVLGYTSDIPQGEIKVTELLGNSGAVALPLSGGPFKTNDKVKAVK